MTNDLIFYAARIPTSWTNHIIGLREIVFTAQATLARYMLSSLSVALFVRLTLIVCPSQDGIVSKRLDESSWYLAGSFLSSIPHCVIRKFVYLVKLGYFPLELDARQIHRPCCAYYHGRPHIGANGVSWPPGKMDEKLKSENIQKRAVVGMGSGEWGDTSNHVYIIIWQQSGQAGVLENGAMLTT